MTRRASGKIEVVSWSLLVAATFVLGFELVGLEVACVSSFVMALSSWLVGRTTSPFNPKRITITGFWYVTYLAMIFLPAFWVFKDQEGPYRDRYLFAVHTVLVTVPIGWILARSFCRFRNYETEFFFRRDIVNSRNPKRPRTIYLTLLVPAIVLAIVYIRSVETIPLFYLLRNPGDYAQIGLLREDSFKLLDSPFLYAFSVLLNVVFPFLVLVSFGFYLETKERTWRNLFFGTLAAAMVYSSLSSAKAPVAVIVAMMGFLAYFRQGGRISRKAVAVLLTLVLLFPIGIVWITYNSLGLGIGDAAYNIGHRLFYVPSEVVYYFFEVFPAQHPYLYGRSIDKFSRLMGWASFDVSNYVGVYARPTQLSTISFNGAFIANLYADFGIAGVLLGGILAGFVMQWFHIWAVRRRKTVITMALYSFLVLTFWYLNSTALPVVLASDGAILVLIVSWWIDGPSNLSTQDMCTENCVSEMLARRGPRKLTSPML